MEERKGPGIGYRLFKTYVRFYHDKVCYRKTWTVGAQNVPADGTPLLIVSNHQNGVNDPLGIVMSFRDRKPNIIARADVFALHPVANKFLRAIGLLPAFRIAYEGEESLGRNAETFKVSEKALLDGGTVAMYPEAGHQDKRWLGTFSYGYTKLTFEAAEMGNFEKEIFILPACNHYSDYFGIRNQIMIRYGTPVSLAPYYELYRTKPRTAQREVNRLVRAQISGMMLNIEDLDHYDDIDFLRTTYGVKYAVASGTDPENLPDMLESDKKFVAVLDDLRRRQEEADTGELPEGTAETGREDVDMSGLYEDTKSFREGIAALGIEDRHFDRRPGVLKTSLKLLAALVLLPLWIFSLWPGIIMYGVARYFSGHRMKDRMMEGTFLIVLSIIFWIPLFGLLTFIVAGCTVGWLAAAVWVLLFPVIFIFAWDYYKGVSRLAADIRFLGLSSDKVEKLGRLRAGIYDRLDRIFLKKG